MTATLRLGLISDTARAARRPAPPPPTKRTSWVVTSIRRTDARFSGRLAKREPAAAKQEAMYFSTGEKSREGNEVKGGEFSVTAAETAEEGVASGTVRRALAFGVSEIKRPATQSDEYTTCTKTSPLKKPLPQVASSSANRL